MTAHGPLFLDYQPIPPNPGGNPMFKRLNYSEPSVLRGIVTAVVALAASIGFVNTSEISGAAEALIPAASFLIPLIQSVWTRAAVFSPETVGKHAAPEA